MRRKIRARETICLSAAICGSSSALPPFLLPFHFFSSVCSSPRATLRKKEKGKKEKRKKKRPQQRQRRPSNRQPSRPLPPSAKCRSCCRIPDTAAQTSSRSASFAYVTTRRRGNLWIEWGEGGWGGHTPQERYYRGNLDGNGDARRSKPTLKNLTLAWARGVYLCG